MVLLYHDTCQMTKPNANKKENSKGENDHVEKIQNLFYGTY